MTGGMLLWVGKGLLKSQQIIGGYMEKPAQAAQIFKTGLVLVAFEIGDTRYEI